MRVLVSIIRGNNYPYIIAKDINLKYQSVADVLQVLEQDNIIQSKEKDAEGRAIYDVKWQRLVELWGDFINPNEMPTGSEVKKFIQRYFVKVAGLKLVEKYEMGLRDVFLFYADYVIRTPTRQADLPEFLRKKPFVDQLVGFPEKQSDGELVYEELRQEFFHGRR